MTRPPSPSTEPSSILLLYAELLLHIRTVTLFASLRTAHTSETKAVLSADGETLTLTHEGHSASIRLPTQIAGGGSAALMLPQAPSKDLTLRLQLQEKSPGLLRSRHGAENVVPWDARQLEAAESVKCAKCGAQLAVANPKLNDDESDSSSRGANGGGAENTRVGIKSWLDLPNENWAEMMDFWHCHKPDEHSHGNNNREGHEKGYAASNKLTARKGVGFVDLAYLLLAEEDCIGVKVRTLPVSAPSGFGYCRANKTQHLPCAYLLLFLCSSILKRYGQQEGGLAQPWLNQWRGLRYKCPRRTRQVAAGLCTLIARAHDVVLAFCASLCLGFQPSAWQLTGRGRLKQDTLSMYSSKKDQSHHQAIPQLLPSSCSDFSQLAPHSPSDQRSHLLCSSCNSHVGLFDHSSNGFRLWKWSLAVTCKDTPSPKSYSPLKWVSAQLLSLIENQGVRKFTVFPDDEPQAIRFNEDGESLEPIEIWVFTPDLSFSSSVPHAGGSNDHGTTDPTRAMKVMWKPAPHLKPDHEQGQALDRLSLGVEEARLPVHVFFALKERLRISGAWIPASAKKMGEWNVGLLERFAEEEA
ncbi:HECT-like ubiquitin-conjugating enzyme-binding-domain-containing protein [Phyllosticta citrichinensis]